MATEYPEDYPSTPDPRVRGLEAERGELRAALDEIVSWQAVRHPLPWRVESDWTEEVIAADGYCIAKCRERAIADRIVTLAERFKGAAREQSK